MYLYLCIFIYEMEFSSGATVRLPSCDDRVSKVMDSKSIGLCPQGLESPRCREMSTWGGTYLASAVHARSTIAGGAIDVLVHDRRKCT